jgi:hypothetical protein
VIEIASRSKRLPAPPAVVWESLVEPHRAGARPWLALLRDEVEPRVLAAKEPHLVVWSSLWPSRPEDEVHFELTEVLGETNLTFTLLTSAGLLDESDARRLGKRLSQLLFADLRYSYGQ